MPSRLLLRSVGLGLLAGAALLVTTPLSCAGDDAKKPNAKDPTPAPPSTTPSPGAGPAAPKTVYPVQPYAGGAVFVDVSEKVDPRVGSDVAVIYNLVGSRKDVLQQFLYETPPHKVALQGYAIDATEVSNAQYLLYLEKAARTVYTTGTGAYSTLQQIAEGIVPGVDAKDDVAWAQILELNRPALETAMPALKGKPKADWRYAALVTGVDLLVYRKRLPKNWFEASGKLDGDAGGNHPVRDLNYYDCREFAEWAGKHIPTEEEWEWAARGPDQRVYPWGDDWTTGTNPLNGKRLVEKRCNWQDLGVTNARHEPTTLPVDAIPEGRSWCGCWHMLGNVAEWTSSWFDVYPGWVGETDPLKNPLVKYPGIYVKTIRGASFMDRERLVLRNAARLFMGAGDLAPQIPGNRFSNVGFRCATYLKPGLDRLETVVARLTRPKKIREEQLAPARLGGAMSVNWTPPGATAPDSVHVLGPSAAVLLCPTRALNLVEKKPPYAHSAVDILEKTRTEEPRVIGAFHTDVPIDKVRVATKASSVKKAGRGVAEPPVTNGKIPAGSYIIGLWFGEVGIFAPNLDFVGFLGKPAVALRKLDKSKNEEPIPTSLSVDPDGDVLKVSVWIPIGGEGVADEEGVTITWQNVFEGGAVEKLGKNWR